MESPGAPSPSRSRSPLASCRACANAHKSRGGKKPISLVLRAQATPDRAHTVQWCAVAPEASQFPWRQELCDASAPLLVRARAKCVALQPARFRASARPSGALTTVPHITAAQAAGTGCSFGRCQGSCDRCCTIGPPKSSPAAHAAWVCTKPRARVERHTRGPAYPDIDIGASQTDSALMRGTARNSEGRSAAQMRMCSFRLPHAKISGPQGGVKHLLFGCERPKNEFFM